MKTRITSQTTVYELLKGRPEIIPLFLNRRMACVGCDMSRFETLGDAAHIYRVNLEDWMKEINQVLDQIEQTPTIKRGAKGEKNK